MRKIALFACLIAIPLGLLSFINAKNADAVTHGHGSGNPIVMELFTSQSCSSCPPADHVLGEFAKHDNVIALSCNVTYWNHLNWQDTLSKEFCTNRQKQYIDTLKSRGPYTPQLVINGRHEMVGSRINNINRTVASELRRQRVKSIDLSLSGEALEISLPKLESGDYTLSLFTYGKKHKQRIQTGENRGKAVSYTNPVQNLISLGPWDGSAKSMSQDISDLPEAVGYAVLAQKDGITGPVRAAAQVKR